MDKDTRVAPARILDLSQQMAQSATEARMLSLRIHEALLQARVPGYLEAYESGLGHLLGELTEIKDKLSRFVVVGIQRLKRVCAR